MAAGLTCTESEELLALAALGVLPAADADTLNAHLTECPACRAAGRSFDSVVAVLPESLELLQPPASLRRRLLAEVYGATPGRNRGRWWRDVWRRIPASRPVTVLAGAAVVAAAVLGVWGATRAGAPGTRTFTVIGTTSEPQAQGSLTYFPATTQAVVTVSGLPQPLLGGGSAGTYELWLVPASGAPRAAGFLSLSPTTHQWTGAITADLAPYVTVAATTEPVGGSPAPTGSQLFSVPLRQ